MDFNVLDLIKVVCVLIGAVLLGRLYQAEMRKTVARGLPMYRVLFTPVGLLVLLVILFPVGYMLWERFK